MNDRKTPLNLKHHLISYMKKELNDVILPNIFHMDKKLNKDNAFYFYFWDYM